jgi:hypothetical protein
VPSEQASTFREFWRAHTASPRQILKDLGAVHAADVPFHRGRYFADLIIGTSVVEVKTGVTGTDEDLLKTLRQTVRYALLAQHNGYEITNTVVYLDRYATIIQTPLQTAADDLAGRPVDLAQARGRTGRR